MPRYAKIHDGEWIRPKRRGWLEACCDCGLIHVWDFRLLETPKGPEIEIRCRRDNRRTALARRCKELPAKVKK